MDNAPNQEVVNDTTKLIMHRLIARRIGRDPSIVQRAKASHEKSQSDSLQIRSPVSGMNSWRFLRPGSAAC
ncbi:MAG: hypothetical protein WCG92_12060 [Hyphomicrobiales bacterium]